MKLHEKILALSKAQPYIKGTTLVTYYLPAGAEI